MDEAVAAFEERVAVGVVCESEAWYKELDAEIGLLLESGLERIVLAIDGSSAAGKAAWRRNWAKI